MNGRSTLELRSFPQEMALLCSLTAMHGAPGLPDLIRQRRADIDWGYFLELAIFHRVYPIVYANVHRRREDIPPPVLRALDAECRKNTLQMLRLCREMELLCAAFRDSGIRVLVLKGPALAQELYGDISLRTSKDLDILVPRPDIGRAERLLAEFGFVPEPFPFAFQNGRRHHLSYFHPAKPIQIELHWRLNPETGKEPSFDELWRLRRTSPLGNGAVYVPGEEDLFFFLAAHGARHSWFRLRWLADIDRMAGKNLNWDRLVRLLREHRALAVGGQAFILASGLLHTPIVREVRPLMTGSLPRRLAASAAVYIRGNRIPATTARFMRYLFMLKTTRQKWGYMLSHFYPTAQDTEILPLPKLLYFLYFPLRPFLLLWRRVKRKRWASPPGEVNFK